MTTVTTTFPATEDPISEGGRWNTTVPASWTTNVSTIGGNPGVAHGPNSSASNDSITILNGSWGPNHTVKVTASVTGTVGAAEIEMLLRFNFDVPGNQVTGYEVDIVPANSNVVVARWNGNQGDVTVISSAVIGAAVDGDLWEASISGPANAVKVIVKLNGAVLIDGTTLDTAGVATGRPGMGFDAATVANGNAFGIKSFFATDGLGGKPVGRFINPFVLW